MQLIAPTFHVLSVDEQDDVLAWLEANQAGVCLTARNYESLSKSMAEIQRYLNQLKAQVQAYEKMIDDKNAEANIRAPPEE